MSKLLNIYTNLKNQDADTLYLFKNGIFYIALDDDAIFLSSKFNLKLVNLNAQTVKCGFPSSSFDKYYLKLEDMHKQFKIVDSNTISDASTYLQNKKINTLINDIKNIDVNTLSVSEAFTFIEKIHKISKDILGGPYEF